MNGNGQHVSSEKALQSARIYTLEFWYLGEPAPSPSWIDPHVFIDITRELAKSLETRFDSLYDKASDTSIVRANMGVPLDMHIGSDHYREWLSLHPEHAASNGLWHDQFYSLGD